MVNLNDVISLYRQLSCNDQIFFYSVITKEINSDVDTVHEFIVETKFKQERACIHCGGNHVVKNGHRADGTQRYKCIDCNRTFVPASASIVSGSRKKLDTWKKYVECMLDRKTLKEASECCDISMTTAFSWRHKILDAVSRMADKIGLHGTVEADETFFNTSYKGNHKNFVMPREAHRRGESVHTKGLSFEKVCVMCAVNPGNPPVSKVGKLGKVSSECVSSFLDGRLGSDCVLCTDNERAYRLFANEHEIELVQMDTDRRVKGRYGIQRINAYHSGLKNFIQCFKGVSTKYLNNYLTWYNLMFGMKRSRGEILRLILGQALTERLQITNSSLGRREAIPSLV